MGISSSACSRCGEEQSQCSKSAEAVTVGRARVARGAVLSCAPFLARSLSSLSLSLSLSLPWSRPELWPVAREAYAEGGAAAATSGGMARRWP